MSKVAGKLHGATTCVLDSALVVPGLHAVCAASRWCSWLCNEFEFGQLSCITWSLARAIKGPTTTVKHLPFASAGS